MQPVDLTTKIVTREACKVLRMRHIGPYHEMGLAWGKFKAELDRLGLSSEEWLTVCHDDPESTPPAEIRSDCCIVVEGDYPADTGSLLKGDLAGGHYLVGTYTGSYEGLVEAWQHMYSVELPACGRAEGEALPFEVYKVHDSDKPENSVTEICIPLG